MFSPALLQSQFDLTVNLIFPKTKNTNTQCTMKMSARCSICRQQLPTLKSLTSHYLTGHSKLKIIRELLKSSILQSTPNLLKHKKYRYRSKNQEHKQSTSVDKSNPKSVETETLYLNENIHILCGQNEIIIGDGRSSDDMEFYFDENSSESKENYYLPLKDSNGNILPKKIRLDVSDVKKKAYKESNYCTHSPSASSEDSNDNLEVVKRKIKRKKEELEKFRHYRINITKLKVQQSLDAATGDFYICHCKEKYNNSYNNKGRTVLQKSDMRIITSDTESCSDTGKCLFSPIVDRKVFCNKCGSGYNNEQDLSDHMQIHETFCRLCNEYFPDEYTFKEHMRLHILKFYVCHVCGREFPFKELLQVHFECHIEDKTFDMVLDMEEEYKINKYNFMAFNYSNSINSILCYLSENRDIYFYSYKFMKIACDICFHEVFFCEYEQHLQNVHCPYTR